MSVECLVGAPSCGSVFRSLNPHRYLPSGSEKDRIKYGRNPFSWLYQQLLSLLPFFNRRSLAGTDHHRLFICCSLFVCRVRVLSRRQSIFFISSLLFHLRHPPTFPSSSADSQATTSARATYEGHIKITKRVAELDQVIVFLLSRILQAVTSLLLTPARQTSPTFPSSYYRTYQPSKFLEATSSRVTINSQIIFDTLPFSLQAVLTPTSLPLALLRLLPSSDWHTTRRLDRKPKLWTIPPTCPT